MEKVLIAMSGGVDSSAAAAILQRQGYDCAGAMLWLCGQSPDTADARAVADRLGIPFFLIDGREPFRRYVMEPFVHSYAQGRTPNPCMVCNIHLKFGLLLDWALAHGYDKIATGHYAIMGKEKGRYTVSPGLDPAKDQSYMFTGLSQGQLAHVLLPLGSLTKAQVRAKAQETGLEVAHKSDSQDICFLPQGNYGEFVEKMTEAGKTPGDFLDESGKKLGTHRGLIHYTVGQRRGLGVSGGRPLYVRDLDPVSNTITLSDNAGLFRRRAWVEGCNWVSIPEPSVPVRVLARARYHMAPQPATVQVLPDGRVLVTFDEAQRALTPGQTMALYQDGYLAGGGAIADTAP